MSFVYYLRYLTGSSWKAETMPVFCPKNPAQPLVHRLHSMKIYANVHSDSFLQQNSYILIRVGKAAVTTKYIMEHTMSF